MLNSTTVRIQDEATLLFYSFEFSKYKTAWERDPSHRKKHKEIIPQTRVALSKTILCDDENVLYLQCPIQAFEMWLVQINSLSLHSHV